MDTINIKRGSGKSWTVTIKNQDGTAKDITGLDFYITFRPASSMQDTDDQSAIIDKQMAIVDAPNGLLSFDITETESNVNPATYTGAISFLDPLKPAEIDFQEQKDYVYLVVQNNVNKDQP